MNLLCFPLDASQPLGPHEPPTSSSSNRPNHRISTDRCLGRSGWSPILAPPPPAKRLHGHPWTIRCLVSGCLVSGVPPTPTWVGPDLVNPAQVSGEPFVRSCSEYQVSEALKWDSIWVLCREGRVPCLSLLFSPALTAIERPPPSPRWPGGWVNPHSGRQRPLPLDGPGPERYRPYTQSTPPPPPSKGLEVDYEKVEAGLKRYVFLLPD